MKRKPAQPPSETSTPLWVWCALAAVLLLAAVVRWRLLDTPLERDEGEYAYMGQLILQGVPPYTLAFNMKLPGIYAAYAVVLGLLGQTHRAIHLALLVINAATAVGVFALARGWLGARAGLAAAAAFAVLSLGQPVQGIFANAEHFVLPFALAGLILLQPPGAGTGRLLGAGGLLGTAVLMKQHGAAFAACGLVHVLLSAAPAEPWKPRMQRAVWVASGIAAPYLLTCAVLAATGAFGRFWFWTVEYARSYTAQVPLAAARFAFAESAGAIVAAAPLLWLAAGAGLFALGFDARGRASAVRVLTFAAFSAASVVPGLFFRPHYFVLTLPAAAVLVAAAAAAALRRWRIGPIVAAVLVAVACGDALWRQREFLFRMTPHAASRSTYGANPFPESLEIARYIREHSAEDDTIAILGSEPQILFYAQRRSASPYIYAYPLMELHDHAQRMQQEAIAAIEAARPRFIVFVRVETSWLQRPGSHLDLFQWFDRYSTEHYRIVGLAEIASVDETHYTWGDEVRWPPRAGLWVAVLERKDA